MCGQKIVWLENSLVPVTEYIKSRSAKRVLLVCGKSAERLEIVKSLSHISNETGAEIVRFSDFEPNPKYRSVVKAVNAFQNNRCDLILAVGGGSAIDVAKCIKLYAFSDLPADKLPKGHCTNDIPLAAMPTTAGSGSESTHFAVIYSDEKKQSVEDKFILPECVFLDERVLTTLPEYQKKSAMLDALAHSVEAYWSVNSVENSRTMSCSAINLITENYKKYLRGDAAASKEMLKAANLAGQAINITKTTAAHAMCYKLTGFFNIAHGHAAFVCLIGLSEFADGKIDMQKDIDELSEIFGGNLKTRLKEIYREMSLNTPVCTEPKIIDEFTREVNPERLKNFPLKLSGEEIRNIYNKILGGGFPK